jgi:hypothetical protein
MSTEFVEKAFSSYTFIKNKYHNTLFVISDLRVHLSSVKARLLKIKGYIKIKPFNVNNFFIYIL